MMLDRRGGYEYEDLLACGRGELFGPGNAQLPLPPMLMFDRISEISETGGEYGKGLIRAELDVNPDLWFFGCHFKDDPVMPGCLGLDALWQMVGFYLGWTGGEGRGRALGLGELKLAGQVLPNVRKVVYNIDIKRVMRSKLVLGDCRRVAFHGRRDYLSREGSEGRAVQAGRRTAAGNVSQWLGRRDGGLSWLKQLAVTQKRYAKTKRQGEAIMRRVVITGMGIVSSIGNNTQEVLASLHEAKSGITRAEKYAELGFRSQVQGAPTLNPVRHHRPARDAFPRRGRGVESRRDGAGDPGFRPRAFRCFQRPHRHHHGLRRPVGAHHRRSRRYRPHQGTEAGRTVRGAEGDVVDGVRDARDLVQDQGRELFDLVGLRHVEPLHRQRL